ALATGALLAACARAPAWLAGRLPDRRRPGDLALAPDLVSLPRHHPDHQPEGLRKRASMADDHDLERLKQIKHIVVLMMETRSFDHMRGFLKHAEMPDVDGL